VSTRLCEKRFGSFSIPNFDFHFCFFCITLATIWFISIFHFSIFIDCEQCTTQLPGDSQTPTHLEAIVGCGLPQSLIFALALAAPLLSDVVDIMQGRQKPQKESFFSKLASAAALSAPAALTPDAARMHDKWTVVQNILSLVQRM
jgi:hypothetical protein